MNGLDSITANAPRLRTDPGRHQLCAGHEDQARQHRHRGLCKRSSKGDSEGLDVEYIVQGGEYDKRKIYAFHLLDGVTAATPRPAKSRAHCCARSTKSVNGIDPNDNSPAAISRRASASLADFNGATFLAELGIERGGKKPDGAAYAGQKHDQQGPAPW